MKNKRFLIYAFRWQLSSLVLAPVIIYVNHYFIFSTAVNLILATVIGNFLGACIFWFVDKWIFSAKLEYPLYECAGGACFKCGELAVRLYRLKRAKYIHKLKNDKPVFLCEECSLKKSRELRALGVVV